MRTPSPRIRPNGQPPANLAAIAPARSGAVARAAPLGCAAVRRRRGVRDTGTSETGSGAGAVPGDPGSVAGGAPAGPGSRSALGITGSRAGAAPASPGSASGPGGTVPWAGTVLLGPGSRAVPVITGSRSGAGPRSGSGPGDASSGLGDASSGPGDAGPGPADAGSAPGASGSGAAPAAARPGQVSRAATARSRARPAAVPPRGLLSAGLPVSGPWPEVPAAVSGRIPSNSGAAPAASRGASVMSRPQREIRGRARPGRRPGPRR